MPFVKLDCGILNSSLWPDADARTVFITALLMAYPVEITEPLDQIRVREIEPTGFSVPPGWYGKVDAAGVGIIRQAGLEQEDGLSALVRLGDPDPDSRSERFDGRRLVRVNGGYIVLNYDAYRQKDHTAAERVRRYRARKAEQASADSQRRSVTARDVTRDDVDVTRNVTQEEVEEESRVHRAVKKLSSPAASELDLDLPDDPVSTTPKPLSTAEREFEDLWSICEKRQGRGSALKAYLKARKSGQMPDIGTVKAAYCRMAESWDWTKDDRQYHPLLATWLNRQGWTDVPRGGGPPQSALKMIFGVKANRTPEEEARMTEGAEIPED